MNETLLNLIANLKMNKMLNQQYQRITGNLSIAEYRGIMAQEKGQEMSCQEISEVMGLSPSRSSRVIDNLVRKGYFIRRISTRDRRSVTVTLSEKGLEKKEKIKYNQQQLEYDLQKKLTNEELNMIKFALKTLLKYFEV